MLPTQTDAAEATRWRALYQLGGAAALLMVACTLLQVVSFAIAPPPLEGTAAEWFRLFQQNGLLGLLAFETGLIVYTLLSIPVALALYAALRRSGEGLMLVFVALSVIGVVAFIMARPALEMLALSERYAAAATEAQRAAFLAAGETMVAHFHGTAFQVSYFLGSIGGLIVAAVMLKSGVFSRATAYLRIASSVLDFGLFVPVISMVLSLVSVLCLLIFNVLVARRLLQLARPAQPALMPQQVPSGG